MANKKYISQIKIPGDDNTYYIKDAEKITNTFTPSTTASDGDIGLVPAPSTGNNDRFLRCDGSWQSISSLSTYKAGTGIDISDDGVISLDIDNGDIIQY